MAVPIRTTFGGVGGSKFPSRVPGTPTGIGANTYGLQALKGISGADIAPILLDALEPAREYAVVEWPRITGASGDTIRTEIVEIGPKVARAALLVGGQPLINDPRNKSHKDYAPFVEFNGTSKTPAGTITHSIYANQPEIVGKIRAGVAELIKQRLSNGG